MIYDYYIYIYIYIYIYYVLRRGKGKVNRLQPRRGPEGGQRYSSTVP